MDDQRRSLLITLSGIDRPGVTRRLFSTLDEHPVTVLDVEQLVVRSRLILAVLVEVTGDDAVMAATRSAVRHAAADLDMDVETVSGAAEDDERRHNRLHITMLGAPLTPSAVASVAAEIAERGGNIDRIRRIASYPVTAIVFEGSGVSVEDLRRPLAAAAALHGADIAVQEAGLDRRGQYLVVMDVDSTLIQNEVIDLLADEAGVRDEVTVITERAMAGELDFEQSLRARAALLTGLPDAVLASVRERITLTPGARTLCRTLSRLGYRIALVSGGFTDVIAPIAAELGVTDVRANTLEVKDGLLTGNIIGPVIDRLGKKSAMEAFARQYSIPMRRTIAIGDGATDVDMLAAAGLGLACNAKAAARAAADPAVNVPYLDSVLFLIGITREEIESADAREGLPPADHLRQA
jgi:phosphoserine phosphatase